MLFRSTNQDVLCFINDDFIFDIRVLYKADEFINEEMGCVGLLEQLVRDNKVPVLTGNIDFVPYEGQSAWGNGVLFFMHKNNWIDVPSELLVCFGDNFVFDQCLLRGLKNYTIENLFHFHAGAKTTSFVTDNGKKDDLFIHLTSCLNNSEKQVVYKYYFIGDNTREIGESLELNQSRISQILSNAENKLRIFWSDKKEELYECLI